MVPVSAGDAHKTSGPRTIFSRRAALAAVAALTLAACGARSSAPAGAAEFIAEDSDFASFREWTSFQLPSTNPVSDLVYPAGARVAYLDQRPPRGATRYPNGTIIVKAIELGAGPSDWEIFARAKRGGDFNAAGAVGWEFFLLRIGADGRAHITSRGVAPTDDGRGPDMGLPSAAG